MDFLFLNFEGLDDSQVKHLNGLLHPSNSNPAIEFPWSNICEEEKLVKGTSSSLNVHAPVFETYASKINNHTLISDSYCAETVSYNNGGSQILSNSISLVNYSHHDFSTLDSRTILNVPQNFANGSITQHTFDTYNQTSMYCEPTKTVNEDVQSQAQPTQVYTPATTFKLNPTVSCFVPSNFQNQIPVSNNSTKISVVEQNTNVSKNCQKILEIKDESIIKTDSVLQIKQNGVDEKVEMNCSKTEDINIAAETLKSELPPSTTAPLATRSWADIVSKGPSSAGKTQLSVGKPSVVPNGTKAVKLAAKDQEVETSSIEEDKYALILGKHFHQFALKYEPVFLQPRGLINRRNWCYINATVQALFGCPPFYSLLRNLPYLEGLDRGKSSTPVIDCMMKVAMEFTIFDSPREELQPGSPFQPDFIYDMLRDLKSDCLKGQQEDAEEFLSFILNGMHEEMVKVIKNYEKKNDINMNSEMKENGDVNGCEEEWQVIGSKHKGMVTRKVAEHKTPISDLLGGQIKSFLTTSGNKTSASIQPFFTLQLDIQSDKVTSVSEALKEMTVKEPIQGYTCAKTKQEIEAYSHVALQKLPPVLILHLKRFVYNKNGGCKKVMKKTDYPVELELSKDLFSSDVKKHHRIRTYKLFAVMYHDGEEAVKGHYISDVYCHGSQTWVRCDDRTITAVSEDQVLSHSPPRVPYLLFYQES